MYQYLLDWSPIIVSLLAVVISLYALRAAAKQFASAARPYAWIENHSFIDPNGQHINQPSTFQIICENAPAKLVFVEYKFSRVPATGEKETIHQFRKDDSVVFPSDKSQYTYDWGGFQAAVESLATGDSLERETRIAYQPLGNTMTYSYERISLMSQKDLRWRTDFEHAT